MNASMLLLTFIELFLLINLAFVASSTGCPSDWTNTDGICYKAFEGQTTDWDSAQVVCVASGGYLAEIPNYFVQKTIATGVTGNCWIGLRSNGTGEYSWRSGRELNEFQFWKDGEPGSHECVSFSGTQSEWVTRDCPDMLSCYICMAGSVYPPPYSTPQIGCYDGEVIEGRCYRAMDDRVTWQIAQWECELLGSDLAEISNENLNNKLISYLTGKEDHYWIGLRRNDATGLYEWRNGRVLNDSFDPWRNGDDPASNIDNTTNCAEIHGDKWQLKECDKDMPYLCQSDTPIPNPSKISKFTVTNGGYSPCSSSSPMSNQTIATSFAPIDVCSGWILLNGICYKKFETETNWEGAVALCKAENASLAEIPNIYVNNVLKGVIRTAECWIGLSTDCTDYSWRIGNFSLSDTNRDVVLNINDTNKCGTIGVNGGERWSLKDCNTPQTCTVCMKGPLTIEYPIDVCDEIRDGITLVDRGSCYRINARRADELDIAILRCNRLNGDLYLFDEEEFNNRLIGIYNSFYNNPVYPKEFVNEYNLFTPQDGYFNLLTSNENITSPVMCQHVSNGELTETDCSYNINFICKIEYEPLQRTLKNDSTQDMYYWSVSGNRNWTEAETQCVTEGGHLVEIFNGDTQDITVSLIATELYYLDELYWIGIGEYADLSSQWRSGANINYSNFSDQIINTQLSCVAIDKYGSWIVSDCGNRYSFVCGKIFSDVNTSPSSSPTTNTISQSTMTPDPHENSRQNPNAVNCNTNGNANSACGVIHKLLSGIEENQSMPQDIDQLLQLLLEDIYIPEGVILEYTSRVLNADVIAIGYNQSEDTSIKIGQTNLILNKGVFPKYTVIIVTNYDFAMIKTNRGAQTSIEGEKLEVVSDVITIVASHVLSGKLIIEFKVNPSEYKGRTLSCNSLTENRKWNSSGIMPKKTESTTKCITNHLTTFAILVTLNPCSINRTISEAHQTSLEVISYLFLSVSFLFLLASVIIFIISGKRFFRVEINRMHFNHAVSLLLAIGFFIFLIETFSWNSDICSAIAFLLHFLWTNVFLSSLSLGIFVFYSICIVSVKHTAKKLYKYLIPIGWCVSFAWAVIWLVFGKVKKMYITSDKPGNYSKCDFACFLSTDGHLILTFLVPIYVILFLNTCLLSVCLVKIRFALKTKNKFQSELSILRKVSFGAILLIPALSLPFILAIPLSFVQNEESLHIVFEWIYIISNAPIGVIHFILITSQIPEARLHRFLCSLSQQPTTVSVTDSSSVRDTLDRKRSIHFNIVRPSAYNKDTTVYGNDWVESRL